MNHDFSSVSSRREYFLKLFAPGIYIALVLLADWLIPIGTFTPFFAVLGMMVMALALKPSQAVPWSILYTGIVCLIFLSPKMHLLFTGRQYSDQSVIPLIRAATYALVGVLSCYLCFILNRLRRAQQELAVVLNKLPSAILVSNQNGKILYSNDTARDMIPELEKRRSFYNFFDLLAPPERQGKSISEYLQRMESNNHDQPMPLSIYGLPYQGETRVLDWMGETVLLTIVSETKPSESSKSTEAR